MKRTTRKPPRTPYKRALDVLRLVPDEVLLATATAVTDLDSDQHCLVATAVRQEFLALLGEGSAEGSHVDAPTDAKNLFGGRTRDWRWVYLEVTREPTSRTFSGIERAFTTVVAKAVSRSQ